MRLSTPGRPHLTYCTNIHPGESWPEVRSNLEQQVLTVRERIAPDRPFGLGLRLGAPAAEQLERPAEREWLRGWMAEHGLYLFTLNGFPYGPFHGQPVKEQVYLPDWADPARLEYTNRLARLLAELMPDDPAMRGTISTVPGAFAPRVPDAATEARIAGQLAAHAAALHDIERRTGRHLVLALEPEPCCHLETVEDAVRFFREQLFGAAGVERVRRETGLPADQSERLLRRHLGVCLDACHMAVEFEDPADALRRLDAAGIAVPKAQISAGLRVHWTGDLAADGPAAERLRGFADPVYLHQVVERRGDGDLRRFLDLPEALDAHAQGGGAAAEWRIHFHVPLFRERLGPFASTQPYVARLLALLAARSDTPHWEVETYTWDVLPEEHRGEPVADAVARELEWVQGQVGA